MHVVGVKQVLDLRREKSLHALSIDVYLAVKGNIGNIKPGSNAPVCDFTFKSIQPSMELIVERYRNDSDEPANHRKAIEALAAELSCPVSEVEDAYESEFARLKETARVTDYLALFASRRAREVLVRRP